MSLQEHSKTSLNWRLSEQLVHYRAASVLLVLAAIWALSVFIYLLDRSLWQEWQGWLLLLSAAFLVVLGRFLWLDYVKPSQNLRAWLLDVHAGDLSSRVSEVDGSSFNAVCHDLNSMAHMLEAQSRYGVAQLQRHTEHLTDKTRMRERAWIAYELHDSLAQTIGGMRFQARVLEQSLRDGDDAAAWRQLEKLEHTLEATNREVRDLISYFHTTSRLGDFEQSVDEVITRFRGDNPDTKVFFHKTWPQHELPREFEIQVLKIIQEALSNVQKHARASLVRVMMRDIGDGHYRVLVEDNGVGMHTGSHGGDEHIGLTAMKDRAARIGGELSFESEHDEGVRVALDFFVKFHGGDKNADEASHG